MKSILGAAMIICFGISWPINVMKTYRTKSTKGKSIVFLMLVFVGYVFGDMAKLLFDRNYVLIFYLFNTAFVCADIVLYFRYSRLERQKLSQECPSEV
jgi:hypothetical protein